MRKVDPARHQARRRHIMTAAAPLFAAHGLEGTSTARIREAAGVSSGTLFHYFPSKRAILVALLTDDDGDGAAHLAAAREGADPRASLLDLVERLAAPVASPVAAGLVMEGLRQAQHDPELARALEAGSVSESEALTHLLDRVAREGRGRPVLGARATAAWIQTLIGALFLRAATETGFDATTHLRDLRPVVGRLVGGDDGPPAER
ncbi:TetR/AcrR family transcriptional regulator [Nocardiopsis sp. NPDC007018]|uniref:TetR/AcrR family transcriptional regulator n=1 Tax=Nocardiopsis sp. NPDC007018 TaxID=3155721 RepID=UPI0033E9B882